MLNELILAPALQCGLKASMSSWSCLCFEDEERLMLNWLCLLHCLLTLCHLTAANACKDKVSFGTNLSFVSNSVIEVVKLLKKLLVAIAAVMSSSGVISAGVCVKCVQRHSCGAHTPLATHTLSHTHTHTCCKSHHPLGLKGRAAHTLP